MDKYTILDFLPKSIVLDVKNKESSKFAAAKIRAWKNYLKHAKRGG